MKFKVLLLSLLLSANSFAAEKTVIRIGVQSGGTVEWELPALQDELKARQADVQLDIQHVANAEAGKVALQSGAVDIIVSDWIWVSGLREKGADFTFYPYSDISGVLMVPKDSGIHSLQDLKGKRLGIAGGELDKNWLLLQTLAKQQQDMDLDASVKKVFAAPPLLNEQIKQGRIDAVLNYWHFAARLEAEGYRTLIDGRRILQGLGVSEPVANIGYVFKQSWANQHKQAVKQFLDAGKQAKQTLCSSDTAWQKIIPLTKIDDEKTQKHLRQNYCAGNIEHWGEAEQQAAEKVYILLHKQSKQALTGNPEQLQPGTFW
ncbi:ABC transporter substrate-binding protein [Methylobacter sp.]|uniref:ABC transporter substrate-binding protein n=1 Tax=Methylobacter sp. TaxID=2051955 RepID=UPI0024871406|nr:ABC transporter substrate-binding protein [Methylobacter sp.]MDI1277701.1 transporter substrate-binding domain-containing protein [Methylobacter sp.]MDI1358264.1 transporter substrate-binding domain-containing protein [Methylobacter sp.]